MFDPSKFIFQPRPLQSFDIGSAFKDLADTRLRSRTIDNQDAQAKARLGEDQAQRRDVNSLAAANFAKTRSDTEYETAQKKAQEGARLAELALTAQQGNDISTVEALGPLLPQYGGTFKRTQLPDGTFDYSITAPPLPTHGPLDVQGARHDIYGGDGPSVGQPFEMQSNVGPDQAFAERGQPSPGKNPFERLSGASAAAAGQPPPEAVAPPGVNDRLEEQSIDPVAGAQNPLNPPAFQPMHQADIASRNREQLEPMLHGIQAAAPSSGIRMGELNEGVLQSGRSPADAFKNLYTPALNSLIKLENGQQMAASASGRLDQSRANAEATREDKLRKEAQQKAYHIVQNDALAKIKTKLNSANEAATYVDAAVLNPNAANTLVTKMYTMNEDGLITNQDFTRTAEGMQTIAQAWKTHTLNELFSKTGINPRMARNIKEVIAQATKNQRAIMKGAANKMYAMYKSADTEGERRQYKDAFMEFFPSEFYPPEFAEPWEMEQPGTVDEQAPSGQAPPAGGPPPPPPIMSLPAKSPVPKTIDGQPKMSPNGVPLVRGSRVPAKPPKKPAKAPTQEELQNATEDELMQMLRNAK